MYSHRTNVVKCKNVHIQNNRSSTLCKNVPIQKCSSKWIMHYWLTAGHNRKNALATVTYDISHGSSDVTVFILTQPHDDPPQAQNVINCEA